MGTPRSEESFDSLFAHEGWVRRLALALFVVGLLVQVGSTATSFLEDQVKGTYYDAQFSYRMSYAPLVSQTRLLVHYATSDAPAPIGLGFYRWFVFLAKAGVSRGAIFVILALELLGTVIFTAWLEGLAAKPRHVLLESPQLE